MCKGYGRWKKYRGIRVERIVGILGGVSEGVSKGGGSKKNPLWIEGVKSKGLQVLENLIKRLVGICEVLAHPSLGGSTLHPLLPVVNLLLNLDLTIEARYGGAGENVL